MTRSITLLLAILGLIGCEESTSEPAFEEAAGCYDLTLGAWNGQADEVLVLPQTIELRDELGTDGMENGRRLVRPFPDTDNRSYPWAFWEPLASDSIRVIWSTGFTGIGMRVARRPSGYTGLAESFLDYPGNTAQAPVTLERRVCT